MIIKYLGHSGFWIQSGNTNFVVDPFVSGNSLASGVDLSALPCDYLLLTHAHEDHVADVPVVLENNACTLIACFEIVTYFKNRFRDLKGRGMNVGGKMEYANGTVRMVSAVHSSTFEDGTPGGLAVGYLIEDEDNALYLAGDTALHLDMQLLPAYTNKKIISVLPIGGTFTMDATDALTAAGFTKSNTVIGCHYDTFPMISIDHESTKALFNNGGVRLILMTPGEHIEI